MEQLAGMENLLAGVTNSYAHDLKPLPPWGDLMWPAREAMAFLHTTQATGISFFRFISKKIQPPIIPYLENTAALFTCLYQWETFDYYQLKFDGYWSSLRTGVEEAKYYTDERKYTEATVREIGFILLQVARGLQGTITINGDKRPVPF